MNIEIRVTIGDISFSRLVIKENLDPTDQEYNLYNYSDEKTVQIEYWARDHKKLQKAISNNYIEDIPKQNIGWDDGTAIIFQALHDGRILEEDIQYERLIETVRKKYHPENITLKGFDFKTFIATKDGIHCIKTNKVLNEEIGRKVDLEDF